MSSREVLAAGKAGNVHPGSSDEMLLVVKFGKCDFAPYGILGLLQKIPAFCYYHFIEMFSRLSSLFPPVHVKVVAKLVCKLSTVSC